MLARQLQFELSRRYLQESLAIHRARDSRTQIAIALAHLGRLAHAEGQHGRAERDLHEAQTIAEDVGYRRGVALVLHNLGRVAMSNGQHTCARELFDGSAAIGWDLGDLWGLAEGFEQLALLDTGRQDYERAARLFGSVKALIETMGASLAASERAAHDQAMALVRSALGDETVAALVQSGEAMRVDQAVVYARQRHNRTSRSSRERRISLGRVESREHSRGGQCST